MRPTMSHLSIRAVRADALFVSTLQRSDEPSAGQVRLAIAAAVRQFGSGSSPGHSAHRDGASPAPGRPAGRLRATSAAPRERRPAPQATPPRRVSRPPARRWAAGAAGRDYGPTVMSGALVGPFAQVVVRS
jgi:hypothetical protein